MPPRFHWRRSRFGVVALYPHSDLNMWCKLPSRSTAVATRRSRSWTCSTYLAATGRPACVRYGGSSGDCSAPAGSLWKLPFLHGKTQSPSAVAATRRAFDGRSAPASLPASSRKRILRLGDPLWALHDECFARNMSGLARTSLCPFHWPRRSSFICVSHIMSFSASDLFRSFLYLDEQETILRLDTMLRAASDTSSADAEG